MLVKGAHAVSLTDIYEPAKALGGENATLSTLLNPLIANILIISGIVAFGTIILSGFTYITAAGDKAKTTLAGQMMTYGIIGIVVVVAAFIITRLIGTILGFNFF